MTTNSRPRTPTAAPKHAILVAVLSSTALLADPGSARAVSVDAGTDLLVEASASEVKEGNAGMMQVVFSVKLRYVPTGRDPIGYQVLPVTAQPGVDYVAIPPGTLYFEAGQTTAQTLTVQVLGDTTPECDETFVLRLQHSFNGAPLDVLAVIKDDDGPPTGVTCEPPSFARPPADGGVADAGADAGSPDVGSPDVGSPDLATPDAGVLVVADAAAADAGPPAESSSGCSFAPGASSSALGLPLVAALALLPRLRRRRRARS